MMPIVLRTIAWPFKAAAWVLLGVAFVLTARVKDGDTLELWMQREFMP